MKLWLLYRLEWKADVHNAFIIRAVNEGKARGMAFAEAMMNNEAGPFVWIEPSQSYCAELVAEGNPTILFGVRG